MAAQTTGTSNADLDAIDARVGQLMEAQIYDAPPAMLMGISKLSAELRAARTVIEAVGKQDDWEGGVKTAMRAYFALRAEQAKD